MRALLSGRSLAIAAAEIAAPDGETAALVTVVERFFDAFPLKNGNELRAVGQPRSQLTSDRARANGYALRRRPPHWLSHLAAQTARQPTPLLVVFPSGFPVRGQPAGDPEAQIFADLGFAVVRLNHPATGASAQRTSRRCAGSGSRFGGRRMGDHRVDRGAKSGPRV